MRSCHRSHRCSSSRTLRPSHPKPNNFAFHCYVRSLRPCRLLLSQVITLLKLSDLECTDLKNALSKCAAEPPTCSGLYVKGHAGDGNAGPLDSVECGAQVPE